MSGLLVGVDGGGSKTAYALCDLSGAVLARFEGDTTNYNQVGFDGVTTAISEGLAALRQTADLAADSSVDGAVLDSGGTPIPGLYAAGEATGILGGPWIGWGFNGTITAVWWSGLRAGEAAAAAAGH